MDLTKSEIEFTTHSGLHSLRTEQMLDTPIDEAWNFFSNPTNLQELTPKNMEFNIISNPSPYIYEGQIIIYKIKLLPFVYLNWVTEIKNVTELRSFVDEQRYGPYALWHHRHSFEATSKGTKMIDEVYFKIPLAGFNKLLFRFFIKPKLKEIFTYRRVRINSIFNELNIQNN